jgi:phytoene dehydrogenase-like protein
VVSRAEYERLKEQAADDVMANFFRLYPSLKEKIEFRIVSTPFTMEEKTLNSGGSITGWNYHPSETFPLRDFRKMKRSIDTPVRNLFQIGQWSFDPAGVPVCLITAKLAADRVLNISRT